MTNKVTADRLTIEKKTIKGVTILYLAGEVRMGPSAKAFRQTISQLLASGTKRLVIDLEQATYMDSSGVAEILIPLVQAWNAECILVYSALSQRVHALLTVTKDLRLMDIYGSTDDAVNAIRDLSFQQYITSKKRSPIRFSR